MTAHVATATRTAMLEALATAANADAAAAYLEIRTGAQPANANVAATGTLLVTITLADPAFEVAAGGAMDFDAAPDLSAVAVAPGTAAWGRVYDGAGNAIFDGAVATSAAEFNITATAIVAGQTITLLSGTITFPA